ncbi:probable cytochrome P450 6a14 [Anastrepha ludens]|uniref:probable cytochrome P450 6a14 n=1 Tax=Anastrepha ludens TaxID=28586 RepID=UPI0023AFAADB|nr:probable cytochrome P450 6a14 [Anastrepha ludens]
MRQLQRFYETTSAIIAETLRIHPIYPYLKCVANEDYETTTPGLIINSGTKLFIPIKAMQNDPEIYAEPTKFIPERFAVENLHQRQLLAWLPFGEGPRNCIGMRFSHFLIRISLFSLLSKNKFTPTSRTPIPLAYEETSLVLRPQGVYACR